MLIFTLVTIKKPTRTFMPRHDIPNPERIRPSQGEVTANGLSMDQMKLRKTYACNGEQDLYPPEQVGLPQYENGFRLRVVTELAVPANDSESLHAVVVQYLRNDGRKFFRVIGLGPQAPGELQRVLPMTEQHPGLTVIDREFTLGREPAQDGMLTPASAIWGKLSVEVAAERMSRKHLKIAVQSGTVLLQDISRNGTYLPADMPVTSEMAMPDDVPSESGIVRDYTTLGSQRAKRHGLLLPERQYKGKRRVLEVLSRDKPVLDGSVDLRAYAAGREVITVDSSDPEFAREYAWLRQSFVEKWRETYAKKGAFSNADIVGAVKESVRQAMKYRLNAVEALVDESILDAGSSEINLGKFMQNKVGICRHMGLAAAWLLNEAVAMKATPSRGLGYSEANSNPQKDSGHEWARYVTEEGEIFIVDPAFDFAGALADVPGLESEMKQLWEEYFRSDAERQHYEALYEQKRRRGIAPKLGKLAKIAWNFLR